MTRFLLLMLLLPLVLTPACKGDEHAGHQHAAEEGQLYTCAMDPQVIRDTPGTCPICGMDLVEKQR